MNVGQAVAKRLEKLLKINKLTVYKFCRNTGIIEHTLRNILKCEDRKTVSLSTVLDIARGFNMTLEEFFSDPLFADENLSS